MNKNLRNIMSITMAASLIGGMVTGCSYDLGPETLPSTTESTEITETEETEPTDDTEETTESAEETSIGPLSTPIRSARPADINGLIKVESGKLVNKDGNEVQLRGISSAGLNKCADIFNENVIATLGYDWGCDVIRLAVVTEYGEDSGYVKDPDKYFNMVCKYTDTIIEQGLYVVIDWDIRNEGDPMKNKDSAVDFFSRLSAIYGDKDNIIYEIASSPSGKHFDDDTKDVTWGRIRKYAGEVTAAIRENDPDNLIICGTPDSCRGVDLITEKPLKDANTCYSVQNYIKGEEEDLRDKCKKTMDAGLCLIASEWTAQNNDTPGITDLDTTSEWLNFLEENKISWIFSSIGNTNADATEAILYDSDILDEDAKLFGHWPDEFLSDAGRFAKNKLMTAVEAQG